MPPLPAPDQYPLDSRSRALASIYAPRILKPRKSFSRTRMLEDLPIKPSISPFHPLPAIGQKFEDKPKTNVIVFDLKTQIERVGKLHDVFHSPPSSQGYRKKSLEPIKKSPSQCSHMDQPQHLLRENTYDVIEPVYINAAKERDRSLNRRSREREGKATLSATPEEKDQVDTPIKVSPKTRFKKAAMQVVKLSSMPETGKLLCLRERQQTFSFSRDDGNKLCSLQEIPRSPTQKLTKLSEIFQCLDTKGRHRDRMKKENSWF